MAEKYVGTAALDELIKYIKPIYVDIKADPGSDVASTIIRDIINHLKTGRNILICVGKVSNTRTYVRPTAWHYFISDPNSQDWVEFMYGSSLYRYAVGSGDSSTPKVSTIQSLDAVSAADVTSKF